MELNSNASKEGSTFLVSKSNQAIPARTETLVQCELRYEDGSKATKLEGIVNPWKPSKKRQDYGLLMP